MAAKRVADERGEVLGERIGYSVRFEEVASARTRIATRPRASCCDACLPIRFLRGVGAVVLDEFTSTSFTSAT